MANLSSSEIENELKRILKIPFGGEPDGPTPLHPTGRSAKPVPIGPPPGFAPSFLNTVPRLPGPIGPPPGAPAIRKTVASSPLPQSNPSTHSVVAGTGNQPSQLLPAEHVTARTKRRNRRKGAKTVAPPTVVLTSNTPPRRSGLLSDESDGEPEPVLRPVPGAVSLLNRALSDLKRPVDSSHQKAAASSDRVVIDAKPCQLQIVHTVAPPDKVAAAAKLEASDQSERRVDFDEDVMNEIKTASKEMKSFNLAKLSAVPPKNLPPDLLNILKSQRLIPVLKRSPKHPNAKFNCILCKYHCDNLIVCEVHIRGDRHIALLKEQCLDISLRQLPLPNSFQTAKITELIENIVNDHEINDEDFEARLQVVEDLNLLIATRMPAGCQVQMFGSVYTQLGLRDCKLDVHLDVDAPTDSPPETPLNPAFMLRACLDLLRLVPAMFVNITSDFEAKMPSISFVHLDTGLPGIIHINKTASVQTSKLLREYSLFEPRLRKLAIAFRLWAKTSLIDNQFMGTLPPHAFDLMLVYFMQQLTPPVLPVLHEFVEKIEGVEYASAAQVAPLWQTKNEMSLGYLWVELFRYYSIIFPNVGCALCITDSKPVPLGVKRWQGVKLGIEDPYTKKRNLSRCISSKRMCDFILSCFKLTFQYFGIPQTANGPLFPGIRRPPPTDEDTSNSASGQSGSSTQTTALQPKFGCYLTDDEKINHLGERCGPPGFTKEDIQKNKLLENVASSTGDVSATKIGTVLESSVISHFGNAISNKVEEQGSEHSGSDSDSDGEEQEGEGRDVGGGDAPLPAKLPVAGAAANTDGGSKKQTATTTTTEGKTRKSKKEKRALLFRLLPTPDYIVRLIATVPAEDYLYGFLWKNFTGGLEPLIECTICLKEGHVKSDCPDEKLPPIIPLPPANHAFSDLITRLCVAIADHVLARNAEVEERDKILLELKEFTRQIYPDAEMKLFGSSCNGFGFRRSDLDICLTFKSNKTGEGLNFSEIIVELAEKLKNYKGVNQVIPIPTAKVPIVKFVHHRSRLDCDLSLYNNLAHHNTQMLLLYTKIDARVPILGCMVKHFAKVCSIGDASRGSLSSYAYILMMLHFLQQRNPPVIPVLQEVYFEGRTPPEVMVDGWNAWFFQSLSDLKSVWLEYGQNKESVGQLWVGFLRYYVEEFNFKENVVNIRRLKPLGRFEKLWNSKCLAIEDPFNLAHNLGSGISRKMSAHILKAFIKGRELFGTPIFNTPQGHNSIEQYLMNPDILTGGKAPPCDGCCLYCKRIGHWARHCPRKENDERRRAEQKRGGRTNDNGGNNQMSLLSQIDKQMANRFPQSRPQGRPEDLWNQRAPNGNWRAPGQQRNQSPKGKAKGPPPQQRFNNSANSNSVQPHPGQYQQFYMGPNAANSFQLFGNGSRPTRPLAFKSAPSQQMTLPKNVISSPPSSDPRWVRPGGGSGGNVGSSAAGPQQQQNSPPVNLFGFMSPPTRSIPPFAQQQMHRPEFNAAPGGRPGARVSAPPNTGRKS